MSIQRRLLPSMSALAAFDAAARTGSFSAASQELNLTQSAISRQIKILEDQIGGRLFIRERRRVRLTALGKTYAKDIRESLYSIGYATLKAINNPQGKVINLAILPTFGSRWLIPRLRNFLDQHPDITFNFANRSEPFDFSKHGLDASIHYGKAEWPGCNVFKICDEVLIPVCAPSFRDSHDIKSPQDLLELPLLHVVPRPNVWQDWFAQSEITDIPTNGMHFEQFNNAIHAAAAGLGIGLLPKVLIETEITNNQLVPLFDLPLHQTESYHLVIPKDKATIPALIALRNWMMEQTPLFDEGQDI